MSKHKNQFPHGTGFTIVELLIVIVVIGILAALVVSSFSKAQENARVAKVKNDITVLNKSVQNARTNMGKTFMAISGSGCTRCACPYASGDTTPYNTLPKTHNCWVRYYATLDAIAGAADTNLDQLKEGDPWGSPYAIDENEGEISTNPCRTDVVYSFGRSSSQNGGTVVGYTKLPFSLATCI